MNEDKMMMYITIATLFATLVTVMQGWWQELREKKKNTTNDNAIEDSLRGILKQQSRDFMRISQSYELLASDIRDDLIERIRSASHVSSSEHQELREENHEIRRDIFNK